MLGRHSPTTKSPRGAPLIVRRWALLRARRTIAAAMLAMLALAAQPADAADVTARLRFAWGSVPQSLQKWSGKITAQGATFTDLQPLGIEGDEAAAFRLVNGQVVIAPLVRRPFDGCDVTVSGDESTIVLVQLHNESAAEAKEIQVALGKLASEHYRAALDDLGAYLLVHRTPGDDLRVAIERDHMIFQPKENLRLSVSPELGAADLSQLTLEARLRRVGEGEVLWEKSTPLDADSTDPIPLELPAPAKEGAYRLTLAVRGPSGFAEKFVPWDRSAPVASRSVEFVVIDPAARVPRLTDKYEQVEMIDAAESRWWQKFPEWTQVDRLPGLTGQRPLGNLKPLTGAGIPTGFVELPPARIGADPAWQAYPLSIAEIDRPHAVEIELPHNARQHLGVSIIEPDAAGRVIAFGRDAGAYGDDRFASGALDKPAPDVHRVVFWPRTTSPVLLLSNRSPTLPLRYGKIRVLRRQTEKEPAVAAAALASSANPPARLAAAYISLPRFADSLGAAESFDDDNKLSIKGWAAFLSAATRLAQELDAAGYNAAIVSIAADGASLAPIPALGASPRYDAGSLSSAAPDPLRKDLLEALLRVFDREGLRLIPAVELATPLPRLEALRSGTAPTGLECVARDGRPWSQHYPVESAAAPHYNILNAEVQSAVAEVVTQLAERYGQHASLGGVALQLSGHGYGVLPGAAWAMDDATLERFALDAKLDVPATRELVLGPQLARWKQWRQAELTSFYEGVAAKVRASRQDRQLVLCTEDLFSGPEAAQRIRQVAVGQSTLGDAAAEIGVDLRGLAAAPGVALLRPRRLGPDESLLERAADMQVNAADEFNDAVADHPNSGELFFNVAGKVRLATFDAQSPFGAGKTYLSLNSPSFAAGDAARRPLAAALAARDFTLLADGAELMPLAESPALIQARRVFQQLPGSDADVRTERRQPATLRIYRQDGATTLCLINESPWPVEIAVPLETSSPAQWSELGVRDADAADAEASGAWPTGAQTWSVALEPYGIAARRFATRSLRVGALAPKISDEAVAVLTRRIDEIEQRMVSLDIERPYNELENPDFELTDAAARPRGWQPRIGRAGAIVADAAEASSGARSLHLRSEDSQVGVAAQSHQFPIPATGQLVVRVLARGQNLGADAQLYAWIEYDDAGAKRRRCEPLANARTLSADWTECEVAVNALPLGAGGQMRIHFHLVGRGDVWIDNVRLFDLRFANSQQVEIGKWLYAAKSSLDQGDLVECQRLVEDYLPQYVLEHVPPALMAANPNAPAAPPANAPQDDDGQGTSRRASRWFDQLRRR